VALGDLADSRQEQPGSKRHRHGGALRRGPRAGGDALHAIEAAELGDVSGKRILHLQCSIGRDTLCFVRRGAVATGLDFSGVALDVARRLSKETGLKANFVRGTVDEAPHLTPGPFDLVFATWGTGSFAPGTGGAKAFFGYSGQTARNRDPGSAWKRDPQQRWDRLVPVANRRVPRASRSALTSDGDGRSPADGAG
jgi:hypothetical protein